MKNLFGLNFYDLDIDNLCKELKQVLLEKSRNLTIFTPNVDHIISVKYNENINKVYKKADYLIADGWPLVTISKMKNEPIFKITGVDLADKLLKIANDNKYNVFFLGATDSTLKKIKDNLTIEYPGINKFETYNGYFKDDENDNIINLINANQTDILFVGMGHPKQEIWIDKNKDKLNSTIMLAVGGAFKIYSKEIKRAPILIQRLGMEWFWRFLKEPKRLFGRYFVKYPKFVKIGISELLSSKNRYLNEGDDENKSTTSYIGK